VVFRRHPAIAADLAAPVTDIYKAMVRARSGDAAIQVTLPGGLGSSTFDHPPTDLSDPDAPTNRTPISIDGPALRHCESGADEAGQRGASKAVGEHDRHAGTERTAGEQLERPTLFRVDATLSRGDIVIHSHSYDMCWKCADGLSCQPSSARRPASVIRRRAILILRAPIRMISQRAVARPSWTKSATMAIPNPWASNVAPEQPRSPTAASISSARRCSALRWGSRGVTVTMCDVVGIAGKAQGGKSGVMGVLLRTFQAYLARLSLTVAWPT